MKTNIIDLNLLSKIDCSSEEYDENLELTIFEQFLPDLLNSYLRTHIVFLLELHLLNIGWL